MTEPDAGKEFQCHALGILAGTSLQLQSDLDVFSRGQGAEQIECLKDKGDLPATDGGQLSLGAIGHVATDLLHPRTAWRMRDSRNMHAAGRQLDEEEHVITDQSAQRPDLNGEQIRRRDALPVTLQEGRPGPAFAAFRRRHDPTRSGRA